MTTQGFIDLVLVLVAAEAVALAVLLPRLWPHVSRRSVYATLAAGAALILALRALAHGASVFELSLWLALSLVAHVVDLSLRLSASQGDRHG